MAHTTDSAEASYVREGGRTCLFCGHADLERDIASVGDGVATIDTDCRRCGESWTEEYKLESVRTYDD